MKGNVDDSLRALIEISIAATLQGQRECIAAWIDTAFNGGLVIPRTEIGRLRLSPGTTTQAMLDDGNIVELETFTCYLDWFGAVVRTQVVANDGAFPLLGTMLLENRRLLVDYALKEISLD